MEPSDLDSVIRAVRAGNLEAYSAIVEAHQQDVLAVIAFRVPDRSLVEEIAQQTFVYAFEHLGEYSLGTDFGAWLRAIARNRARAELKTLARSRLGRAGYREHLRLALLAEAEPVPEEERFDVLERMRGCLAGLPETSRKLIESHYFARKPVKEVASDLGRTVTWVTTSMMRARRAIRACLESSATEGVR